MHTPDQDLFMLAHRALGPLKAASVRRHIRECPGCRRRYAEFDKLSGAVALAVRVGMPAWRPIGVALKVKILVGVAALVALLAGGGFVLMHNGSAAVSLPANNQNRACATNPSPPAVLRAPGSVTIVTKPSK